MRDRQFYGFLSDMLPKEVYPAPIAEPLTWIPHAANASAMSQVWLFGARMGPLERRARPHRLQPPRALPRDAQQPRAPKPQAAVVSITRAFDFPPLNGSVNPADGQLYLAGFQILGWGTTATRLAGLGRVRYTGAPSTLPREVVPMDEGVLLRFDVTARSAQGDGPRQLLARELALQTHVPIRLAAAQGRRHARASIGSRRAARISRRTGGASSSACRA